MTISTYSLPSSFGLTYGLLNPTMISIQYLLSLLSSLLNGYLIQASVTFNLASMKMAFDCVRTQSKSFQPLISSKNHDANRNKKHLYIYIYIDQTSLKIGPCQLVHETMCIRMYICFFLLNTKLIMYNFAFKRRFHLALVYHT